MLHGRAVAPLLVIAALVAACSSAGATATTGPIASAVGAAASAVASAAAGAGSSSSSSSASGYDNGGGYGGGGGSASAAASGSGAAAASGDLAIVTTSLGKVLAGPTGMTLYELSSDTSSTSACNGSCASNWPPLTGAMPMLGTGLNASDFATLSRTDGAKQITFHGHPLYYFSGDQAAGDTKGQGIASKWYVVGTDGNPIK
jgi:predicted lipoprotein with Yx(FWY)xxD motif